MDIEIFRDLCLSMKDATESFPFGEHTLVFKVKGKIFALLALDAIPPTANLKSMPEHALNLREEFPRYILPGYHMNKKHWNTLQLEYLSDNLIKDLIEESYKLVIQGLPLRLRRELDD